MRYLSLALFAEGESDHGFLQGVLFRLTFETANRLSESAVEISESFTRGRPYVGGESRVQRIERAFGGALSTSTINLLFIHADGDSDAPAALRERIEPCISYIQMRFPTVEFECVPVIPVRASEAWALADPNAVIAEFGTKKSAPELGIDFQQGALEKLQDPKMVLKRIHDIVGGRRRKKGHLIPAGLGNRIELNSLRSLPAFRRLESELESSLRRLWKIDEVANGG